MSDEMSDEQLLQDPAHLQELMHLMMQSIAAEVQGDAAQALALLDQVAALNGLFVPALIRRAGLLLQMARYEQAVAACDDCLHRFPGLSEALQLRHRALLLALEQDALLLRQQPADVALLCRQAQWLMHLERFGEALSHVERALVLAPLGPLARQVLNLQGKLLLRLNRHEEALHCYDVILATSPGDAVEMFNRGNVLQQMGQLRQACWSLQQALVQQPGFAEAEVALSHCLFLLGDYAGGWHHHEARWRTAQLGRPLLQAAAWQGQASLQDSSILLWAEQGLGDTIQFARYIPWVAAQARAVTVCVPPVLERLLKPLVTRYGNARVTLVCNDKYLPAHDFHCPLMSLPLALQQVLEDIPAQVPYLQTDAGLIQEWAARLASPAIATPVRLKVGLVWAGRQSGLRNHTRDMALHQLRALAALPLDLISLQHEVPPQDQAELLQWPTLRCAAGDMTDMAETAALISNLDLVISVDTAVIHLAGALARPAWLMLRYESEWRWGAHGTSSSWYPTVRIFRQSVRGDWSGVVQEVAASLRLLATRSPGAVPI